MNTIASLDLLPAPRPSLMSAVQSLGYKLRVALYGPKLVGRSPEGETVQFCPACEEAKVRFDIHVALVSGARSLPVMLL